MHLLYKSAVAKLIGVIEGARDFTTTCEIHTAAAGRSEKSGPVGQGDPVRQQ